MKVLKENDPHEWVRVFECTGKGNGDLGCRSLLEVHEDDLEIETRRGVETTTFTCPVCDERTIISAAGRVTARVKGKKQKNT